jgi:hypothetical protein
VTDPDPLTYCAGCHLVLSATTEDLDWPGLCVPCVQTGTPALRVLRDRHRPPTARRSQQEEDEA